MSLPFTPQELNQTVRQMLKHLRKARDCAYRCRITLMIAAELGPDARDIYTFALIPQPSTVLHPNLHEIAAAFQKYAALYGNQKNIGIIPGASADHTSHSE